MSQTSTATGGAVFKAHNVTYAIEKIGDFFRGTGSGILAGWPETSAKIVVEALQELSVKLASAGMVPEATVLPMALYSARELQKYLKPAPSDIPNRDACLLPVPAFAYSGTGSSRQRNRAAIQLTEAPPSTNGLPDSAR